MKPLRVVIDTNLVLSALVFGSGTTAALRQAWQPGAIIPLLCKATAGELIRVLAYPKFKIDGQEQQDLLADYLPWCGGSILLTDRCCSTSCRHRLGRHRLSKNNPNGDR